MSPAEVERQREIIMRAILVVRDREYPFAEDVIVDETGAVNPNLWIMGEVSSLIEVLPLGGKFELVYQLWAQFTLSAVRVNMDVTWSVFPFVPYCLRSLCAFSLLRDLVQHSQWDVSSDFVSLHHLGKITRKLQRGVQPTRQTGAGLSSHLG